MFVEGTNRAVARNITDEGERILQVVASAGENGMTRKEISMSLGGKALNKWSIAQITLAVSLGRLICYQRQVPGRETLSEYVYVYQGD